MTTSSTSNTLQPSKEDVVFTPKSSSTRGPTWGLTALEKGWEQEEPTGAEHEHVARTFREAAMLWWVGLWKNYVGEENAL